LPYRSTSVCVEFRTTLFAYCRSCFICFNAFLGGVALAQAIPHIATHFGVAWSVCLSVCLSSVGHIRAPCLNRSTDLNAIWQVHLWGHSEWFTLLRGVPDSQEKGSFRGRTHCENMQLQIAAATWRIQTRSDSAFSQITLLWSCHICNCYKLRFSAFY